MKTIRSIKSWLRTEQKRLEQRTLQDLSEQELISLNGSLITIKKVINYISCPKYHYEYKEAQNKAKSDRSKTLNRMIPYR